MSRLLPAFKPRAIAREKKTVSAMVRLYCADHHQSADGLCPSCADLLAYSHQRLDRCRYGEEKPACKACPTHCYQPSRREAMRQVMREAGPKMLFAHPWLALAHLWKERNGRVILAFALVYVFWGSTYLGIRVAVERVPPILLAGVRFSVAGSLMLAFCALTGRRAAVTRRQFAQLATVGFILLGVSNAALAWSELYVPTGLAALIVAIVPIWFLLVERFILPTGDRVTASGVGGVALGALGVVVLFWPKVSAGHALGSMQLVACLGLLGSSFFWAFGSVLSRRWKVPVDPLVASGWQMLTAGVIDTAAGLALGDHHRATWNGASIGAIAYLVVFGSWVGYSAYIWLLRHVPTAKVATYAYVNPVIAVFLGWLVLGESFDRYLIAGAAIIVPAVALVTRSEDPGDDAAPVTETG